MESNTEADGVDARSRQGLATFCPHMGRLPDTNVVLVGQLKEILTARLRMASAVVALALAIFIVRNLLAGLPAQTGGLATLVAQVVTTLVVAAIAGLLFLRKAPWSLRQLRLFEITVFGTAAACVSLLQWEAVRFCPPEEIAAVAAAYPSRFLVPWILLIQAYGLFIPNTWRRALLVTTLLALTPVAVAIVTATQQPLVRATLREGGDGLSMVLWLAAAAAAAIYAAHRFSEMRRDTFDARTLGLYTLRAKLGAGGMGEVYLAEHQLLKRPCAIKLIRADKACDSKTIARFETEVKATARLTHPNTVTIFDFGVTRDQTFFYVMEFLPGMNLDQMVQRFGPLPPERVVYLLRQICSALAEAHAAGLIHRDIKPGNIFVSERGGLFDVAKLLDFGLVKTFAASTESVNLTMDGTFVGSPLYAPPESTVGDGKPDARSDIYSLGATAYHLLTGEPVFKDENPLRVIFSHANEVPVAPSKIRSNVPLDLEAIVIKCLQKQPAERFANVTELDRHLAAVRVGSEWTQQKATAWWKENGDSDSLTPVSSADTVSQIASVETA